MTLKMSFDEFSKSPTLRRLFIEKLAALFGDRDTSSIVISSFISGSVVVTWHNKSLPVDVCLETETEKLRKVSRIFVSFRMAACEFMLVYLIFL